MKQFVLFLAFILFISLTAAAQVDNQWYVVDKTGWQFNRHSSAIGSSVRINGIDAPNVNQPNARDDIFIIFEDGTCYLDRGRTAGWRYNPIPVKHQMKIQGNKDIDYMYFTNVYDDDDGPDTVDVESVSQFTNVDVVSTSPLKAVQANQSVVPGKDITLVLNVSNTDSPWVPEGFSQEEYDVDPIHTQFDIFFDKFTFADLVDGDGIVSSAGLNAAQYRSNMFEPSRVFRGQDEFIHPIDRVQSFDLTENKLTVQMEGNYSGPVYINLRSTERVAELINDENIEAPTASIFTIVSEQDTIHYAERNGDTHDPNFIEARAICNGECQSVYYYGQFYNAFEAPANGLGLDFVLPADLDANSVEKSFEIKLGGRLLSSTEYSITVTGSLVEIVFEPTLATRTITRSNSLVKDTTMVQFEFCARAKNGVTIPTDVNLKNYKTTNSFVYFSKNRGPSDWKRYPIQNQALYCAYLSQYIEQVQESNLQHPCINPSKGCSICKCEEKSPFRVWLPVIILFVVLLPLLLRFFAKPKINNG